MAAKYAPDAALLSVEALALDPAALEAYADVATDLLGLWETALVGEKLDRAERAVALQVNHMVAQQDATGAIKSITRGKRSVTYATTAAGTVFDVSAAARAIAENLLAGGSYGAVTSFR